VEIRTKNVPGETKKQQHKDKYSNGLRSIYFPQSHNENPE